MPYYEQLRTLISSHLEDLEHNRLPLIQKRTGFSMDLIQETLHELRKLNPKPGATFTNVHVPTITPDVFIEQVDGGKYKVILEDGRTPSLRISPFYRQMLQNGTATAADKEYIKKKITSAQWLIESIEQRRSTLTRVAQAIVDYQTEFLNKGPEFIEPLKMQQIADRVGVHVTTVSRAVDDKWIQTPRGVFPLKRFFGGGTVSAEGDEVAWDTVRLKLQEIVDAEDKHDPRSDDDLVKELAKHGLTVARRTVTKYRKAMKIPSSRQRRDWTAPKPAAKPAAPTLESQPTTPSPSSVMASEPTAATTSPTASVLLPPSSSSDGNRLPGEAAPFRNAQDGSLAPPATLNGHMERESVSSSGQVESVPELAPLDGQSHSSSDASSVTPEHSAD
jgi:RNA polymerase sigma-54 factor